MSESLKVMIMSLKYRVLVTVVLNLFELKQAEKCQQKDQSQGISLLQVEIRII